MGNNHCGYGKKYITYSSLLMDNMYPPLSAVAASKIGMAKKTR